MKRGAALICLLVFARSSRATHTSDSNDAAAGGSGGAAGSATGGNGGTATGGSGGAAMGGSGGAAMGGNGGGTSLWPTCGECLSQGPCAAKYAACDATCKGEFQCVVDCGPSMPGDSYMCVLQCEAAKGDALTTEAQELYACDSGQASAACCFKDP